MTLLDIIRPNLLEVGEFLPMMKLAEFGPLPAPTRLLGGWYSYKQGLWVLVLDLEKKRKIEDDEEEVEKMAGLRPHPPYRTRKQA